MLYCSGLLPGAAAIIAGTCVSLSTVSVDVSLYAWTVLLLPALTLSNSPLYLQHICYCSFIHRYFYEECTVNVVQCRVTEGKYHIQVSVGVYRQIGLCTRMCLPSNTTVHTYVFTVKYDCAHVFAVKYDCAHTCVYRQI